MVKKSIIAPLTPFPSQDMEEKRTNKDRAVGRSSHWKRYIPPGLWLENSPCQSKGNYLQAAMEEKSEKKREAEGNPCTITPPS